MTPYSLIFLYMGRRGIYFSLGHLDPRMRQILTPVAPAEGNHQVASEWRIAFSRGTAVYRMRQAVLAVVVAVTLLALELGTLPPAQARPEPMPVKYPSDRDYRPVVLLHGAYGARLREKGSRREIWPGPPTNFVYSRFTALALAIDSPSLHPSTDGVEAYALVDGYGGVHSIRPIEKFLEDSAGYVAGVPGENSRPGERRYYTFIYDWRRDLVELAADLDGYIDQIRRDYSDPDLKVDIVAYSSGGLLVRYFLLYGSRDVLDSEIFRPNHQGAAKTRRVVLVGVPNTGSTTALHMFVNGRRFGGAIIKSDIFATMPAAYQVLPHPDREWIVTLDGQTKNRDLYSTQTWREFKWSIYDPKVRKRIRRRLDPGIDGERYLQRFEQYFAHHLKRAQRFHRAISVGGPHSSVDYAIFGGDCKPTSARYLLQRVRGRVKMRRLPSQIDDRIPRVDYAGLLLEPGDGRVTQSSLLAVDVPQPRMMPAARTSLACVKHKHLTTSPAFQQ